MTADVDAGYRYVREHGAPAEFAGGGAVTTALACVTPDDGTGHVRHRPAFGNQCLACG
jgi:hypothetical protein